MYLLILLNSLTDGRFKSQMHTTIISVYKVIKYFLWRFISPLFYSSLLFVFTGVILKNNQKTLHFITTCFPTNSIFPFSFGFVFIKKSSLNISIFKSSIER